MMGRSIVPEAIARQPWHMLVPLTGLVSLGAAVGVVSLVEPPAVITPSPGSASSIAPVTIGAAGDVVSTVNEKGSEAPLWFPAASVAWNVRLCGPSPRGGVGVNVQLPLGSTVAVPIWIPLSNTVTTEPGSVVPLKVGVGSSVEPPAMIAPTTEPVSS